jgi:hypothetical protein
LAEGHQVILGVGAALIDGKYVVDFVRRNQAPCLQALLAKRMFGNISVTNLPPAISIYLVVVGRTLVFVVFPPGFGLVFIAVAPIGKFRASRIAAGLFGFIGHGKSLLLQDMREGQ